MDESGSIVNTYSYNAYGTALICDEKVSNAFRYTDEYYDAETGLYYLRARYMNPATGTFTQEDTYQGNIYDALSLYKYLYAQDNPVIYKDPTGNMCSLVECVVAAGNWAMNAVKDLWHNIIHFKSLKWFTKGLLISQFYSLTEEIKGFFTLKDKADRVENICEFILTLINLLGVDFGNWFTYITDSYLILKDLRNIIVDIIDHDRKSFIKHIIGLGVDVLALICDIAKIKFDAKIAKENLERYRRTDAQKYFNNLIKSFRENGEMTDELADRILYFAQIVGNWDDAWILIFHNY